MNARKQRRKARRRAGKHVELAWQAIESGRPHIAQREMQRAVAERPTNPLLWYNYGAILERIGALSQADKALKHAVLLAPDYADAYALLATLAATAGRERQAVRLLERAVSYAPGRDDYRARLESMAAVARVSPAKTQPERSSLNDSAGECEPAMAQLDPILERFDWRALADELHTRGVALLPGLLSAAGCRELRESYARDELFEKTVVLESSHGHGGSYRFFAAPLPELVRRLRGAVYAAVAPIANAWNERLGIAERFAPTHAQYLRECAAGGQSRSSVILLRYRAPAANELHRDIWGKLYFPLQLAVVLSRRAQAGCLGFRGGDFVFADQGVGRRCRRREIAADLGDGVLFCGHDRPVNVGGVPARQSVFHGMSPLTEGERYVLGCPFHEYKS